MIKSKYKRILLKLSGEAISGKDGIIDFDFLDRIANTLIEAANSGVEVGVIFGAGNIWRGRSGGDMDRVTADRMGMLATVINSLAAKDAIIRAGGKAAVLTSTMMEPYAEYYTTDRAVEALKDGKIVIFAGGTGSPYFSTDTTTALRSIELECDVILMARAVDGVYDSDPKVNPNAKRYETIPYMDVLNQHLTVMDTTAVSLCMDNNIKICAFGLATEDSIRRVVCGESLGTLIC